MATIGGDWPTLLDVQKTKDPSGRTAKIVELLRQANPILMDAPWYEGNLPTGHQITQRTGLPDVYFRRINQGVPASKATTAQIVETASMLEAFSKVDVRLIELNGQDWQATQEFAFAEAMNQKLAETLFYGDASTAPDEFTGLAIRYSDTSTPNGVNILNAGGVGSDNTSMWLIHWGTDTAFMFYPKGASGGLQHQPLGVHPVADDNGHEFMADRSHWKILPGFALANWQGVVRIANIDVSNLVGESSAADIIKLMTKAVHKIPNEFIGGKPVFYANRTVMGMLDIQAQQKSNVYLTVGEEEGRAKVSFRGIPIRSTDAILENEDVVS